MIYLNKARYEAVEKEVTEMIDMVIRANEEIGNFPIYLSAFEVQVNVFTRFKAEVSVAFFMNYIQTIIDNIMYMVNEVEPMNKAENELLEKVIGTYLFNLGFMAIRKVRREVAVA